MEISKFQQGSQTQLVLTISNSWNNDFKPDQLQFLRLLLCKSGLNVTLGEWETTVTARKALLYAGTNGELKLAD